MDLKPTKPLSGFIELLPAQQRCFDECARRMQEVLHVAGYSRLDLPAIERAEVLSDKDNWDEIETQMFLFQKGDTKMGLRYRRGDEHRKKVDGPCRCYHDSKGVRFCIRGSFHSRTCKGGVQTSGVRTGVRIKTRTFYTLICKCFTWNNAPLHTRSVIGSSPI